MVGKKVFACLCMLLLSISSFIGCTSTKESSNPKKIIKIGISQIVEHPALDASRKGFVDALKSKNFNDKDNIQIDFQNAQGDIATTQTIAQNFVSQNKDIILAISTPSAQSAFNSTKKIPIVITAVTDPVKVGLVKNIQKPDTNVTGTSDVVPIKQQFELIKKILPNAKKIGILYNTSEVNSQIQVDNAKEIAKQFDMEIILGGVTNTNEISQSLSELLKKVDVLYTPTDNLVASAMPLISKECIDNKIPVIGAEKAHVEAGALATEGIDYYKLGFQTGLMAVDIINGKNPKDMPIQTIKETELAINMNTAKKLNIPISSELKEKAVLVEAGE